MYSFDLEPLRDCSGRLHANALLRRRPVAALLPTVAFSVIALLLGALASPATAQTVRSGGGQNNFPQIGDVTILVYDVNRGSETIAELKPGETVTINPGQKARLRMQIRPNANSKRARYPSARYEPTRPLVAIKPVKLGEAVGSYTFFGERQGNRRGAQAVDYEITDYGYSIPDRLRRGRVFIALADVPEPEPAPEVKPEAQPEPTERLGVTLYEHTGFRGRYERLYSDDPNLRDNPIGNDRLSSIEVDRGCVVRLFEASEYRGEYDEVRFDLGDFDSLRVRNDHVSSIQVDCSGDRYDDRDRRSYDRGRDRYDRDRSGRDDRDFRRGVTLYVDADYRGESTFFEDGSYADLRRSEVGEGRASSLTLSRGCVAVLYQYPEFRGRSLEVRGDVDWLRRTDLGDDAVASIRVLCR